MDQRPLLSIAIPTYNRADFLKQLLKNILPQATALQGQVRIHIFNNCSTDITSEVVARFQSQYPDLVECFEQPQNLGANVNFATALEKSTGQYVWLLGDDDEVAEGGVKKVVDFIKDHCSETTGLVALGHQSYITDKNTGKNMVFFDTVKVEQPAVYEISRDEVLSMSFPNSGFISILMYRTDILRKIFAEEKHCLQEALKSRDYIYTFIYRLMFLKYPHLRSLKCNQLIIREEAHHYKFYIEDKFQLHYVAQKQLCNLLIATNYGAAQDKSAILDSQRGTTKNFIIEMGLMKAFDTFNYSSFIKCITNFFKKVPAREAIIISLFFVVFWAIPSLLLRSAYWSFTKLRLKEKQPEFWLQITVAYSYMAQGNRRQLS